MGARVAAKQIAQRIRHRGQEYLGHVRRQNDAQGIAQARGIFHRRPLLGPCDGNADCTTRRMQRLQPGIRLRRLGDALRDLHGRQRAQLTQQVGHAFAATRVAGRIQALQLALHGGHHGIVQQFAQVHLAEQFRQQATIQRQHRCAPLGQGYISFVHELGDIAEQQVRREGRWHGRIHLDHLDLAGLHAQHQRIHCIKVVDALQALARGLHQDRELIVATGDLQQLPRTQALLPQRRALARRAPRQQQRARGTLTETCGEQRGTGDRAIDDLAQVGRIEQEQFRAWRCAAAVGHADDDAVVAGHHGRIDAGLLAQARSHRQRPGIVHAAAVGRMQHHPPVAEFITAALDDQAQVGRQHTGGLLLFGHERQHVADRAFIQAAIAQPGEQCRRRLGSATTLGLEFRQEGAGGLPQLGRAADAFAPPERQSRRAPRRWRHHDLVKGDLVDAPGRCAEGDHIIHPRLMDHLLVQLADTARSRLFFAFGQHDGIHATVGNGAAAGYRQLAGARTCGQRAGLPVPYKPRAETGELIGRIAAGQHVHHRVEGTARQRAVRRSPAHACEPGLDIEWLHRYRSHGLLGQHIERIARRIEGFDASIQHAVHHHRSIDQITPRARIQQATRDAAHLMPCTSYPLHRTGHRRRRRDLDHQVHQAHVDAQFKTGGGDHAAQFTRLQRLLDGGALFLGHRAVVRAGDHRGRRGDTVHRAAGERSVGGCIRSIRFARRLDARALGMQLVESCSQPFRHATRIGKDNRRPMPHHVVENAGFHMRPDRTGARAGPAPFAWTVHDKVGHVLHRHHDLQFQLPLRRRLHHLHRAITAEEGGNALDRADRCRQADALRRHLQQRVEPLQAQRQVRATLAARHRMDLIEDHRMHIAQDLPRLRGQHQVQRLGRGDQDVRRAPHQACAVTAAGIAGTHGHGQGNRRIPTFAAPRTDALQGHLQVALHVAAQRLDRRQVQHARARHGLGGRVAACVAIALGEHLVDRMQERSQRLARPGWGHHQGVLARGDRRPRLILHRR